MVTRTFITKSNTIVKGSHDNFGLDPVCRISYGARVSRAMVYFDLSKLEELYANGTYSLDRDIRHILKLGNCGTAQRLEMPCRWPKNVIGEHWERAVSFDLIAFAIPYHWDQGIGFDREDSVWVKGKGSYSKDACNWYQRYNGRTWHEEGIYDNDTLADEYVKWGHGEESVIINRQHFDHGNESIEIDVTDYVNACLSGSMENHGICLAFSPLTEISEDEDKVRYIDFFNEKTNTVYQPVLETRTMDGGLCDDRNRFYIGKKNRLYFYSYAGGEPVNLDALPICTIDGIEYPVVQQGLGTYYAEVKLSRNEVEPDTVMYDVWSGIVYDGEEMDDVEMQFVALNGASYFSQGSARADKQVMTLSFSGIADDEKLTHGDRRMVVISMMRPYEKATVLDYPNMLKYRIYAMDGKNEIDIISWDDVDMGDLWCQFIVNTSEFVPNHYFVDIAADFGRERKIYKKQCHFWIVDNSTRRLR